GAAHELVVLGVDELWREELLEQRAVPLDEPRRPLILESDQLDGGTHGRGLLLRDERRCKKREEERTVGEESAHWDPGERGKRPLTMVAKVRWRQGARRGYQ